MYNFCTLFNSNYLSRGLAAYYSLEKVCRDFHLYIFAFDDQTFEILNKLNLHHATVISLEQFEDGNLLRVKGDRTIAEYCWTATPATIYYALKNFNVEIRTNMIIGKDKHQKFIKRATTQVEPPKVPEQNVAQTFLQKLFQ